MGYGSIKAHALMSLEARGILFVSPGLEVSIIQMQPDFLYFLFMLKYQIYFSSDNYDTGFTNI